MCYFDIHINKILIYFQIILQNIQMFLQTIVNIAKQSQIERYISGIQTHQHVLQKRDNKLIDGVVDEKLSIELPHDVNIDISNKINGILLDVKQKYEMNIETQVKKKLRIGEKLPNFGQLTKVFGEGTSELSAKQGEVLLIDIWATWCGPCQQPMRNNQKMLEKNNWQGKVRIVGVSVDDSIETTRQRIIERGWNRIQHLTLQKWDHNHPLIKLFNLQSIPFVILVDKKGYIVYTGHPSTIRLQDKINQVLLQTQQHQQNATPSNKTISIKQVNKIVQTLSNKQFFEKGFGHLKYISTKVSITSKAMKGNITHEATITVYVFEENKNVLEEYEKLLPSKHVNFEGRLLEIEAIPPTPNQCFSCKNQLDFPLYWCRWSKQATDFRCRKCIEQKIDDTHFSYPSNSILIPSKITHIPKANMGRNIQPLPNEINDLEPHQFGCNFCGIFNYEIGQPRYVCLGCKLPPKQQQDFFDLCQDCIEIYLKKQQEITESLQEEGHCYNHPFVRILYNVKGYGDF